MITLIISIIAAVAAASASILIQRKHMNEFFTDTLKSHSDEVNSAYAAMSEWRHDYKSQIQTMKAYMADGRYDLLESYLNELDRDLVSVDSVVKTGSVALDAVLNAKLTAAGRSGIRLKIDAKLPDNYRLPEIDLCRILSNLIENAAEAAAKTPKDGFIRVYIGLLKGQLYISVLNSTNGEVIHSENGYVSTKSGSGHGLGIRSIERTISKYGGWMEQKHDEDLFSTEILLPL
ncbi:MAG: ATP-binding protein [bacterium]|nr:ATP-binding protein [bacterium]